MVGNTRTKASARHDRYMAVLAVVTPLVFDCIYLSERERYRYISKHNS